MYDSILYPTDGSRAADAAIAHVRNQANKHDASVHVLYAIDLEHAGLGLADEIHTDDPDGMVGTPSGSGAGMVGSREDTDPPDLETRGHEIVERAAERFPNLETETVVRTGDPSEAILDYVDEAGIDMIVMSTQGRSGLDRYMLGSVTEKIVRFAEVPVLSVRATDA